MADLDESGDSSANVAEYEGLKVWSTMTGGRDPELVAKEIYNALADRRWDFRTIPGIAKETRLRSEVVRAVLEGNRGNGRDPAVRVSLLTGENGELLYTLASRSPSPRERAAEVQALVTF